MPFGEFAWLNLFDAGVMTLYLVILAMYAPLIALIISYDYRFGIAI